MLSVAFSVAALAWSDGSRHSRRGPSCLPWRSLCSATASPIPEFWPAILPWRNVCPARHGAAARRHATRNPGPRSGLGGLALGAASFTNYLASFIGAAMLLWLMLRRARRPMLLPAAAGFGLFVLLFDLPFFLAQRASRPGQFAPFSWATRSASWSGTGRRLCSAACRFMPAGRPPGRAFSGPALRRLSRGRMASRRSGRFRSWRQHRRPGCCCSGWSSATRP